MASVIIDQAALWEFIRETLWISVVTYVSVLVLAAALEITRLQYAKVRPLHKRRQVRFSANRNTRRFFYIELFRFVSNITICVIYVYTTYARQVATPIVWVNRVFAAVFAFDFIIGCFEASNAVLYTFKYARFLQIFSLPSLFIASGPNAFLHFGFLRAFSAYDSYIRVEQRMLHLPFAPKKFALRLFIQLFTLFYVLAAGIQLLEIPGDILHQSFVALWENNFGRWHFFNCIYYVIVTLSTVGYGDFSPATIQGRIYTIFMIIVGIIVFSNVANQIMTEMSRQRGDGSYDDRLETRHVILSGTPTLDDLVHFVTEFYADTRESNMDCDIVVLIGHPKWTDTEWHKRVATNNFLTNHITYLVGTLKNPTDLTRAGIATADAVFILTSPAASGDASRQDSQTVMSALAVRTVRTDIPIFSQILLEESHTQISVAMNSPRSKSYDPTLIFRNRMSHGAMYRGIYRDIQRLEFDTLAQAFRPPEVAESEDYDVKNPRAYETDLDRSTFVCLQQLYSALLVANIKANGVSTLCTNMYLDIPENPRGSHQGPTKQAWLKEYRLGASCSLVHALIPQSLDNVSVDSVAALLLRRGIVIVASQKHGDLALGTVLSTKAPLCAGELGLFLTYLNIKHLATALHLAGQDLLDGKSTSLSNKFKAQRQKPDLQPRIRRHQRDRDPSASQGQPEEVKSPTAPSLRVPKPLGLSRNAIRDSRAFDFPDIARPETDYAFDTSRNRHPSPSALIRSRSHWDIPAEISNHIILAMEGNTPLENLPFFLKLLWKSDGRISELRWSNVPVVIIHPQGADGCDDLFREFDRNSLFFVRGSPATRKSWQNAKLGMASSVATFADYTQDWEIADGRTVYTLLTLDAETTEQQNLFICSELIDERSLDFLREPLHPRRRGAKLGNPIMRTSDAYGMISPRLGQSDSESEAVDSAAQTPTSGHAGASMQLSTPFDDDCESDEFEDEESPGDTDGPPTLKEDNCATDALFGAQKMEVDSAKRPGASRARRRELFARFRYTSGELLVHSTADTLLVREYAEPGFVKFIAGLCGVDSVSPGQRSGDAAASHGQKIRLVRIPKSVFREFLPVNGQRVVEYGVLFERLVALGVTPLGLYRSGEAPVRLPKRKRSKRGVDMLQEAALLPTPAANATRRRRGLGLSPVKAIVETSKTVLPGPVRARQGQQELLGEAGHAMGDATRRAKGEVKAEAGDVVVAMHSKEDAGAEAQQAQQNGQGLGMPTRMNSRIGEVAEYRAVDSDDRNLLPYVYTMPEIGTLVAETDGVYILCDPAFELPRYWPSPQ